MSDDNEKKDINIDGNVQGGNVNIGGTQNFYGTVNINAPDPNASAIRAETTGSFLISYSRRDRDAVKQIYADLESLSFKLWQDIRDIEGGKPFWEEIKKGIDACESIMLCLSEDSLKSEFVQKECQYARQEGKRVIPVVVGDVDFDSIKTKPYWIYWSWISPIERKDFREGQPDRDIVWASFIRTLNTPYTEYKVPFMASKLPDYYINRPTEFENMVAALVNTNGAVATTVGLQGAGGFGKTTLALALCHDVRVRGAFYDGILWVTLGEKPSESVENKALELIYKITGETPPITSKEAVKSELQKVIGDRHMLLVIDDLWHKHDADIFLTDSPNSAILITTRFDQHLPESIPPPQKVDAMRDEEAVNLLIWGIAQDATPLQVELLALAKRLGRWPVLLSLTNATLVKHIGFGETLEQAIHNANEALDGQGLVAFDIKDPKERSDAVKATIGVSLGLLDDPVQAQFAQLAVFPEDANVPFSTLGKLWGLDNFNTRKTAEMLQDAALLASYDLKTGTIRLHDVIRQYLINEYREYLSVWQTDFVDSIGDLTALADEYTWRNIAYHLRETGDFNKLKALIDTPAWMKTQHEHFGDYGVFLQHTDLIWQEAVQIGNQDIENKKNITTLGTQIKSLLLFSSIASIAKEIPPLLPALLVQDDMWEPAQAFEYISRVPDTKQRVELRLFLLTVEGCKQKLTPDQLEKNIKAILLDIKILEASSNSEVRGKFLLKLIPFLEPGSMDVKDAITLAMGLESTVPVWRARTLANLLGKITRFDEQVETIQHLIFACGELSYNQYDDKFQYVPYIYQEIAANIPIEALPIAWQNIQQRIREDSKPVEEAYEHEIKTKQRSEIERSLLRAYDQRFDDEQKLTRFFDYLSWYIPDEKAEFFVNLLYALSQFEWLPYISTKIARLSFRLSDQTSLQIAKKLLEVWKEASPYASYSTPLGRSADWYDGTTSGCGIALITLAYNCSDPIYKQQVLEITIRYIKEFGKDESPITQQDLDILYEWLNGRRTDAEMAKLVKDKQFLANFWHNLDLRRNNCELIQCLGHETILTLFEKCTDQKEYQYLHIGNNPYILPAIIRKLPNDKLGMIYRIGEGRGEIYGSLGYFFAAIENINRMPKEVLQETLDWSGRDYDMSGFDDPYRDLVSAVTPHLHDASDLPSFKFKEFITIAIQTGNLSENIVRQLLTDKGNQNYKTKGNQLTLQLLQCLPQNEYKALLNEMLQKRIRSRG